MTKATAQVSSTSPGSDHEDRFATLRQPPPTQAEPESASATKQAPQLRSYFATHNQQSSWHEAAGQAAQNSISKERRGVPAAISATHRTQQKVRRDIFGCILQRPPLPAAGPAQLAATHQDHDRTCEALTGKADTRWQQFTASTRQGNSKGGKSPEKRVTPQKKPHNHTRKDHRQQQDTCWQHITDTHQQPWREGKTPVTAARGLVNKPRGASKGPHQQRRMHQKPIQQKTQHQRGSEQPPHQELPQKARQAFTDRQSASGTAVWGQGRDMLAARHRTAANTGRSQPKKQSQRQSLGR